MIGWIPRFLSSLLFTILLFGQPAAISFAIYAFAHLDNTVAFVFIVLGQVIMLALGLYLLKSSTMERWPVCFFFAAGVQFSDFLFYFVLSPRSSFRSVITLLASAAASVIWSSSLALSFHSSSWSVLGSWVALTPEEAATKASKAGDALFCIKF
jgi:hypothetical protein